MEHVFDLISKENDILPMTTIEIIDYLKAMGNTQITDTHIQNNSNTRLWFAINDVVCEIKPREIFALH